jgi:hypothetical protein
LSQHEVISAHITIPDNVVSLFVAATEHGFSQDSMLLHIQCLGKEGVLVELSELGHLFLTFGVLWGLEILQLVGFEGAMEDRSSLALEVLLAGDLTLICILKQLILLSIPSNLIQGNLQLLQRLKQWLLTPHLFLRLAVRILHPVLPKGTSFALFTLL